MALRLAILLLACGVAHAATDSPYVIRITAASPEWIQESWSSRANDGKRVLGYASFDIEQRTCHVRVPAPADPNNPTARELQTWGHELYHCHAGRWHQ